VVGKGHLVEQGQSLSTSNAAQPVARLHGEQPVDGAALGGGLGRGIGRLGVKQRQQHHGGVVDIGIELVGEFEGPAGGFGVGRLTDQSPLRRTSLLMSNRRRASCGHRRRRRLRQREGADRGIHMADAGRKMNRSAFR